jgi:hypothetical protein
VGRAMSPILTERVERRRPRPANETRRSHDLTPEEQTNVRAALRFLRTRLGSTSKLAAALRANIGTLRAVCLPHGRAPSAAVAIRAARVAGVSVEDVLSGAWPPARACPHCGRA